MGHARAAPIDVPPIAELERARGLDRNRLGGARDAELVAAALERDCAPNVVLFHNRRLLAGTDANVDHLAVAPTAIWVIDTSSHTGRVEVDGGRANEPRLVIGGRDRTILIDGLDRRVAVVRAAAGDAGIELPVTGALCLTRAALPGFRALRIRGYPLLNPRALAKRLDARPPRGQEYVGDCASELARRFPPASRT